MSEGSFPVTPGSSEYTTLGFLVARCGRRFSPDEIAAHTDISATKVSNAVAQLVEWGLVQQAATDFYVDSDQAEEIRQRLRSLDAVVQLFETAPTDDAYAESGWTDEVPSLSVGQDNRS
ncbi:MarR family transcriptional regulator [Halorubrum distributum]|uniref:MarR family transcriptional regulator n=1 Tax=Halorubrum distributum TaxID=29283 RepID=UPI0029549BA7|nr:MarR family transcriptional regulator [Halorubrum distributum]MDV7350977.1 MarR family transcriptional regulator [Halorubrum distributum]